MKSLSLRVAVRAMQIALILAVPGCGGRVEIGAGGAGGATGGQGGAGGAVAPCDLAIGAACDCATFGICPAQQVEGIPCCNIAKMCSGEETCQVAWTGAICEDWCDYGCEGAEDPDQCLAMGCKLTANGCAKP